MNDIAKHYDKLAGDFASTIAAVPDDRWEASSPCEGWTALDVVRHVVETPAIFVGLVGRELAPGPDVDDDPAAAFQAVREQIRADLDDPERANASFDGMFGRTTFAESVDRFLCTDLLVHRWDVAKATGVPIELDPAECRHCLETAHGLGDALRGEGTCGPAVEVEADASDQDKLIAFMGRDP